MLKDSSIFVLVKGLGGNSTAALITEAQKTLKTMSTAELMLNEQQYAISSQGRPPMCKLTYKYFLIISAFNLKLKAASVLGPSAFSVQMKAHLCLNSGNMHETKTSALM